MKVTITIGDAKLCQLDAEIDYKKAIELGEKINDDVKFKRIFAISILDELHRQSDNAPDAKKIYDIIMFTVNSKWEEFVNGDESKDTQDVFDEFFSDIITNYIQFIPLLEE